MANKFRTPLAPEPQPQQAEEPAMAAPATEPANEKESTPHKDTESTHEEGKKKERRSFGQWMKYIFQGDILKSEWFMKQRKLLFLSFAFCIVLIFIRYKIESLQKEKNATEERINYLREERVQMQKEYQESIKISRIAKVLDSAQVGLISGPPYEIVND